MFFPKLTIMSSLASIGESKTQAGEVISRLQDQQRRVVGAKNVASSDPLKATLERKSEMLARQIDRQRVGMTTR